MPGLWLFVGALALYTLTGGFYSFFISDGDVMYMTATAVADHGTVVVPANKYLPQIGQGADGQWYSKYGLGQPLATVPFIKIGHLLQRVIAKPDADGATMPRFLAHYVPMLATACTVLLLYLFAKRLYGSLRIAIGLAVLYALGTSSWPYSRVFFSEPLFCLSIFAAAFCLYRSRDAKGWRRTVFVVLAGFAFSYALQVRIAGLPLALAFGTYLWLINRNPGVGEMSRLDLARRFLRDCLLVALGSLPNLCIILLHNQIRYGNPFSNGYDQEGFTTPLYVGLYGLLFSSGKSVFLYSPVLLALPFAIAGFWRRFRPEGVLCGLLITINMLFYSMWWAWAGDWAWGPRFLVPMLPFAVLPLGVVLQRGRGWVAFVWLVLFPPAVLMQMLGVVPDFNVFLAEFLHDDPSRDPLHYFIPQDSPVIAHWQMLWQPARNTVRGLTLETLGVRRIPAIIISIGALVAFGLSVWATCYNFVREQEPTPNTISTNAGD